MQQKAVKLKPLHGWNASHTTMTPQGPDSAYKYPDGIVLTLKTTNNADHYFVERNFALQLASGIKESMLSKITKRKPSEKNKPLKLKKQTASRPAKK